MKNIEIAKLFHEEEKLKQSVLEAIALKNGNAKIRYCIFKSDHEPLTAEQRKVWNLYGKGDKIHLDVKIDLEKIIK